MSETYSGLRGLLHGDRAVTNVLLTIADPTVAGILGNSGADYVVIDTEHAVFPLDRLRECVAVLNASPAFVVIRVADNDPTLIKQALDLGVDGVQVPTVCSADEVRAAVAAARYAPEGHRGVGLSRASGFGVGLPNYFARANSEVAVLVMIETGDGVEKVAEIAAVDGVDGIVIGPIDLAVALGVGLDTGHDRVTDAYHRVIAAGRAHGVKVGVGGTLEQAEEWHRAGARIFMYFVDALALHAAVTASVAETRRHLESALAVGAAG